MRQHTGETDLSMNSATGEAAARLLKEQPQSVAPASAWATFTRSSSKGGEHDYTVGCNSESREKDAHDAIWRAEWMAAVAEEIVTGANPLYHHAPEGCETDDCPCVQKAQEARRAL